MRSSSGGGINIAASAQKLDVDSRISLRFYYRIADNILKQAAIFREEGNIIDLYVMLLRFSSLTSETIPCHREYKASPQSKKISLKKKLLDALSELEELRPSVRTKINEFNKLTAYQVNRSGNLLQNDTFNSSSRWPLPAKRILTSYEINQTTRSQQHSHIRPVVEKVHKLALSIPRPKEETLSRHSILGPNGLRGQWHPPISDKGVQYPSNLDLTPIEIPSLQPVQGRTASKEANSKSEEETNVDLNLPPNVDGHTQHIEDPDSMISFETIVETPSVATDIIRQPSPPPVLAELQDLVPAMSTEVTEAESGIGNLSKDGLVCSESPLQLHISTTMMENFMKLARSNTEKNLETCGVLAGSLKNRKFYVTALIIPKQESTSDSCQTTNEEEIFEVQDKQSLFPLGWIHTHPSQSCFMSSIDVHTHYSYQIMLPEAIAIVMAPRDSSRKHGIFRLTTPGGMSVIRQCPRRGFHSHDPPQDGGPIYNSCTDVYMNPNLNFDVIDLR